MTVSGDDVVSITIEKPVASVPMSMPQSACLTTMSVGSSGVPVFTMCSSGATTSTFTLKGGAR